VEKDIPDWSDSNLCLHVPDYNDPLVTVTDILNRLRSILEK
jgi:hypothetical protein